MRQAALLFLAVMNAALMLGCGGSVSQHDVITIRSSAFVPTERTVTAGTTVVWVNADNAAHRVVSGVLEATDRPTTVDIGILNTEFTVQDQTINLGDTIRFRNLTTLPRQVEVKDQELNDVFLSPVLRQDQTVLFKSDRTGRFIVRDALQPVVRMNLTVMGVPRSTSMFDSGVLTPGQKFRFRFAASGRFPYFDAINNFESGVVIVQP